MKRHRQCPTLVQQSRVKPPPRKDIKTVYTKNIFGTLHKVLKRLCTIRKPWLLSPKNSTTLVQRLCLVLELNSIKLNGSELQYRTQPVGHCFWKGSSQVFRIQYNS